MKGTMWKGAAVAGLLVAAAAGSAEAQVPIQFGIGGGVTIPGGSTSDFLKTGWNAQALVRFRPAASPVGFQIDGMYQELKFDPSGGKDQIISGTGNLVYSFPVSAETQFRPYIIAGGGIYNINPKPDVGPDISSQTKFGINAGAGFDINVSRVTVYAEGRFHNVFISNGDDAKLIPITVGLKFGGR
ncbi:MAG TPA: outer membrane beta-barrel protein [Gemmatimonadales bacterium]|nr:outer membrane beta-barrel protein [Gemmatimonadales bacterium]